jgi:hypothetical protein
LDFLVFQIDITYLYKLHKEKYVEIAIVGTAKIFSMALVFAINIHHAMSRKIGHSSQSNPVE